MRVLRGLILGGLAGIAACAPIIKDVTPPPVPASKEDQKPSSVQLKPWSFAGLSGWGSDDHGAALVAFQKSCTKMMQLPPQRLIGAKASVPGGRISDWAKVCGASAALKSPALDHQSAKSFFETWFVPYAVTDAQNPMESLFTGYYEPTLEGAWKRGGAYQTPLLARPTDLINLNAGSFDPELGGNTLWGRVKKNRLVPYLNRADIETGKLGALAKPILWVKSPVDAFFLHIQGSGRVTLKDGQSIRVGFAGKNGLGYKSIGRILIDQGEIPANRLTMGSIRAWIDARPTRGADLMRENPSYIFFRTLKGDGPLGAQSVALTPGRSLAVDRRFMPLGVPLWLETHDPLDAKKPFNRLMVAQDTGGAIKGVVRGDIFFGHTELATRRAGNMKRPGRYFILLPHSVALP